jgi:transcriptional regulator with XRE-family HTH domain
VKHPVDIHVGQTLKQLRKMRGLSQSDVAGKLDVSFQQIQKYEVGANRIAASRLFDLSKILGVPASHFFAGVNDEENVADQSDLDAVILKALAAIKDRDLKLRLMSYVTHFAGEVKAQPT